jgi:hypothetical protein
VSPGAPHHAPALQGVHSDDDARPLALLNVDTGHGNCTALVVLTGQK